MRRALAAAALVALAACQVDVEGAPCTKTGSGEECPSGQGCGPLTNGVGRCTQHVGACIAAGTFCTPGTGADVQRCSGDRLETCAPGDDCGVWELAVDCAETHLACAGGATPACACKAPAGTFVVDPSAPAGSLAPTGASDPAECRFKTLGPALSTARSWREAHGSAPATVRVEGATAAAPVVFSTETLPVRVPAGVTLTTASLPPAPSLWIVSAETASGENVVELESGATLEGFTVRSVSATGDGVAVVCGTATARAFATSVRVEGGGVARNGVSVQGTCGLDASALDVRDAAGAGLFVDPALADPAVADVGIQVEGGALSGNGGAGAELRAGFLELEGTASAPFVVAGNQGFGVSVLARDTAGGRPYATVALDLASADVSGNGEAGLLLNGTNLPAAAHATITGSRFHGNLGQTMASGHVAGRRGAGVLLKTTPVSLEFTGNQVFGNGPRSPTDGNVYDQVAVFSTAKWTFSGTDCDAGANAFACPSNGTLVYSSAVLPANYAQAGNAYWPIDPWPPDALVFHASYAPICEALETRLPVCP